MSKKRVKQWFNNHSRAHGGELTSRAKVLDLTKKKKKKLQITQAYSALYYDSKLKDIIADRWNDHCASQPGCVEGKKVSLPNIAFRNKVIREAYEEETQEVKDEVEAYRNQSEESSDDDIEGEELLDSEELKRRAAALKFQRQGPTKHEQHNFIYVNNINQGARLLATHDLEDVRTG
jgi:hypothetical protein